MAQSIRGWVWGVFLLWPALAMGQGSIHPATWDPSWKGLAFGSSREEVLKVLEQRIRDRYGILVRNTLDIRERDRLTREMQREIEEVRESRVVFPAGESPWSVSILREDYQPGQEMIVVREGAARYYLIFHEGRLYKWVTTPADPSREATFSALQQAFGQPGEVTKGPDGVTVMAARWTDAGPLCVSFQDFTREFQTLLVRFAEKDLEDRFRAARKSSGTSRLNPLIDAAKEAPAAEQTDPVDDLIGRPGPVPPVREQPARKKTKGK